MENQIREVQVIQGNRVDLQGRGGVGSHHLEVFQAVHDQRLDAGEVENIVFYNNLTRVGNGAARRVGTGGDAVAGDAQLIAGIHLARQRRVIRAAVEGQRNLSVRYKRGVLRKQGVAAALAVDDGTVVIIRSGADPGVVKGLRQVDDIRAGTGVYGKVISRAAAQLDDVVAAAERGNDRVDAARVDVERLRRVVQPYPVCGHLDAGAGFGELDRPVIGSRILGDRDSQLLDRLVVRAQNRGHRLDQAFQHGGGNIAGDCQDIERRLIGDPGDGQVEGATSRVMGDLELLVARGRMRQFGHRDRRLRGKRHGVVGGGSRIGPAQYPRKQILVGLRRAARLGSAWENISKLLIQEGQVGVRRGRRGQELHRGMSARAVDHHGNSPVVDGCRINDEIIQAVAAGHGRSDIYNRIAGAGIDRESGTVSAAGLLALGVLQIDRVAAARSAPDVQRHSLNILERDRHRHPGPRHRGNVRQRAGAEGIRDRPGLAQGGALVVEVNLIADLRALSVDGDISKEPVERSCRLRSPDRAQVHLVEAGAGVQHRRHAHGGARHVEGVPVRPEIEGEALDLLETHRPSHAEPGNGGALEQPEPRGIGDVAAPVLDQDAGRPGSAVDVQGPGNVGDALVLGGVQAVERVADGE